MSTTPGFGGFDILLEISGNSVGKVINAQHRCEVCQHRYVRSWQDRLVTLLINAPQVALADSDQSGLRASARSKVFYHSRSFSDALDGGKCATLDIDIKSKIDLGSTGPISTIDAGFIVDWLDTQANDINIITDPSGVTLEAKQSVLQFIQDEGRKRRYSIPGLGGGNTQFGSMGVKFNNGNLLMGLNLGMGVLQGNPATISSGSIDYDWVLAMQGRVFMDELKKNLASSFGGSLPPPLGIGRPRISHRCTIGAYGYCANWSNVYLEELDVALADGGLAISGRIKVENTGALVPDVSANFTAFATFEILESWVISVSVGSIVIDIQEWYGDLADFLTGGSLKSIFESGISGALGSSSSGVLGTLLRNDNLNSLAALGTTQNINASWRPLTIDVHRDSFNINGQIDLQVSMPPVAVFPVTEAPNQQFLCDASQSWAPGGVVEKISWKIEGNWFLAGDNKMIIQADLSNYFLAGRTVEILLRISDTQGRIAETSHFIGGSKIPETGLEWLQDLPKMLQAAEKLAGMHGPNLWEVDKFDDQSLIVLGVNDGFRRICGQEVTIWVGGVSSVQKTDEVGRLFVIIKKDQMSPPSSKIPFVLGEFNLSVEVKKLGKVSVVVRQIDLKGRNTFLTNGSEKLRRIEDAVIQYTKACQSARSRNGGFWSKDNGIRLGEISAVRIPFLRYSLQLVSMGQDVGVDEGMLSEIFDRIFRIGLEESELALRDLRIDIQRAGKE